MKEQWVVSDDVKRVIGPALDGLLSSRSPLDALVCQVCGRFKPAGTVEAMRVLAMIHSDDVIAIGFAHLRCSSGAITVVHLSPDTELPVEIDAHAFFGRRLDVTPAAVFAFESSFAVVAVSGNESLDAVVNFHLALGFSLATCDIVDFQPPVAPGWTVRDNDGSLQLSYRGRPASYEQPMNSELDEWLRLARLDGSCLVVTGSGLGLRPNSTPDLTGAMRAGTLVGGVVRVL